jgi:hypothetical protein
MATPKLLAGLLLAISVSLSVHAGTLLDIEGPPSSGAFGGSIKVLSNGYTVVIDTGYDQPSPLVTDVGAVYLYDSEGTLISSLVGTTSGDSVGSSGIRELANGNFVIHSPGWDNGAANDAGAVTWGSAELGFPGGIGVAVSAANSIVGARAGDGVGSLQVSALTNGNYVMRAPNAGDSTHARVGAVTWGNGSTGTAGAISLSNSLMGGYLEDNVGQNIRVLTNGNFVVYSPGWANLDSGFDAAGAATWCSGTGPTVGVVSVSNSLIGVRGGDAVGSGGVEALSNGNYVVASPSWRTMSNAGVGAVTWGNGTTGISGVVSETNSLHGSANNDSVGLKVEALTNGNYVVSSPNWDNAAIVDAGAATWGNGTTGTTGPVSATNSITSDTASSFVSGTEIQPLSNGNYVVASAAWNSATATAVGAATWASGTAPTSLVISAANSLVGTATGDAVSSNGVSNLTNGNYLVRSSMWDRDAVINAGALTWGSGTAGVKGAVSISNSLVGSQDNDSVGGQSLSLPNGNYLVLSPLWKNGMNANAGAVTFGNGKTGVKGAVSPANSLVGSSANDGVGVTGVTILTNNNYVVRSANWTNGSALGAGAATWGSGTTGVKGVVSATNSLVGSSPADQVGTSVTRLENGNYLVLSPQWDKVGTSVVLDAGAATFGKGTTGVKGPVTAANSLTGTSENDQVGNGAAALLNGSAVIRSSTWDDTKIGNTDAGAATWVDGINPLSGEISILNSLIGSTGGDAVGSLGIVATEDNRYMVLSPFYDNGGTANAGAVTLGSGQFGTHGLITPDNSVLGTVAGQGNTHVADYDPVYHQLWVGRPASDIVTLFVDGAARSLARSKTQSNLLPSTVRFGTPGAVSVNMAGGALFDTALLNAPGRDRVLMALAASGSLLDIVFQKGDSLVGVPGFPSNAKLATFSGIISQQNDLGIFQVTASGTGLGATNNRILFATTSTGSSLLLKLGTAVTVLGDAIPTKLGEVLQSYDQDQIMINYTLKTSATTTPPVTTKNDTGILFSAHDDGMISGNVIAREGSVAYGGGTFGTIGGRQVGGTTVHFVAPVTPTTGPSFQALFSMQASGASGSRVIATGEDAPGLANPAIDIASIPAVTQLNGQPLFRATLRGTPTALNEAIWDTGGLPLVQKGTDISTTIPIPFKYTRIIRFWPAGSGRFIVHAQISGSGVTSSSNQVLVLVKSNGHRQILMRTGQPAAGTGRAKLAAFSSVDVHPNGGRYAVLGTLSGATSSSNQALWTGNPALGNDSNQQILRDPLLKLRKGQSYVSDQGSGTVRSISMKPAVDATGAGGRGLAQVISPAGTVAVTLLTDGGVSELVLLP